MPRRWSKALHTHLPPTRLRLGPAGPLFPYPGSPAYRKKWGAPDDKAWERAHAWYLKRYTDFSHFEEPRARSAQSLPGWNGSEQRTLLRIL